MIKTTRHCDAAGGGRSLPDRHAGNLPEVTRMFRGLLRRPPHTGLIAPRNDGVIL